MLLDYMDESIDGALVGMGWLEQGGSRRDTPCSPRS
jgi:hypothetical protein